MVKGIRKKELPEVNDEFAQDLGDFRTVDELREPCARPCSPQREQEAQREAKDKLVEKLVELHEFPVPEAFIDRQVRNRIEQTCTRWPRKASTPARSSSTGRKLKSSQRDKALREVKASLLLSRIAEREAIDATRDEVDKEVERIARQQREPFAALRLRVRKGRNPRPYRFPYPDREDPEFPVRTCPEDCRNNLTGGLNPCNPKYATELMLSNVQLLPGGGSGDNEYGIPESILRPTAHHSPGAQKQLGEIMREASRIR